MRRRLLTRCLLTLVTAPLLFTDPPTTAVQSVFHLPRHALVVLLSLQSKVTAGSQTSMVCIAIILDRAVASSYTKAIEGS